MGYKVNDPAGGATADKGISQVQAVGTDTPTDSLFDHTPPDGAVVVEDNEDDTANVFVRVNDGTWLNVSKTSGGQDTQSGDGSTTAFTISHGLPVAPDAVVVTAGSADADGDFFVTSDADDITITYGTAPTSDTDNLTWNWLST